MKIVEFITNIPWLTVIDITIVFIIVYSFFYLIKSSQSLNLIKVIIAIFALYALSQYFELKTLKWILEKFSIVFIVLIIIIFQPELRKSFERIRRRRFLTPFFASESQPKTPSIIKSILTTADTLSKQNIGALIVLEFTTQLEDYIESGVPINGKLSDDLLISLFWPGSPTHDGAVIIREDTIVAAGCLLPLTESKVLDRRLGTRHMAAIGLSERSDALIIIISEETGTISLAENGNITRFLTREGLETRLFHLYKEPTPIKEYPLLEKAKKEQDKK